MKIEINNPEAAIVLIWARIQVVRESPNFKGPIEALRDISMVVDECVKNLPESIKKDCINIVRESLKHD